MKYKYAFLISLLIIITVLSSCAARDPSSEANETEQQSADAAAPDEKNDSSVDEVVYSSADESNHYSVTEVHSKEELIDYAKENLSANEFGAPALYFIECPFEDYELNEIEIAGSNIYYRFLPVGYQQPKDGPSELLPDLYIGWNYTRNGEHGLSWFVSQNRGVVMPVEDAEGLYYSDGYTLEHEFIGRMYYWVEDNCFFQASVPAERIDDFQTFLHDRKQYIEAI